MMSGPVPVPMDASILVAKSLFGMISYWTSMSGLSAMNPSIRDLFRSIIGGCVCVQNLIVVLSWARAALNAGAAAPSATAVAATPWLKRRRLIRLFPIDEMFDCSDITGLSPRIHRDRCRSTIRRMTVNSFQRHEAIYHQFSIHERIIIRELA